MSQRKISHEEFMEHQERHNLWVLLHGKVYAVHKFLDEHPGGEEVIIAESGKDATEAFEDVGHSDEAREILKTLLVGDFNGDYKPKPGSVPGSANPPPPNVVSSQGPSTVTFLIPLAFLGAYFAWRYYGA